MYGTGNMLCAWARPKRPVLWQCHCPANLPRVGTACLMRAVLAQGVPVMSRRLLLTTAFLTCWAMPGSWADDVLPALEPAVEVLTEPLEIEAGRRWERAITLPDLAPEHVPAMSLRARIGHGSGGCNFMLRILVNGAPLREDWFHPRLLNKALFFEPPGTEYHFSWFRGPRQDYTANAWMMIFSAAPESNWGGTGQDLDFVFALDGLVEGTEMSLRLEHTWSGLPAALNADRAPLVVDRLVIGGLPADIVAAAREHVRLGGDIREAPVEPDVPADEGPGERAYEVVWSGRPAPPAQVTFDDLRGWTMAVAGEARVALRASRAQRIWWPRTAALTIGKSERPVTMLLRPPQPIPVTEPADAVNLWAYGHMHFMGGPERFSPIVVTALLRDARGVEVAVDLGHLRMQYWMLLHGVLPRPEVLSLEYPLHFTGLQLHCERPREDYLVYLEALHVYLRNREIAHFPRPPDPVFPLDDRGILPTAPPGVTTRVEAVGDGARFISDSPTGRLEFAVDPTRGALEGVTARWEEGPAFQPCAGGGLTTPDAEAPAEGELISSEITDGALVARWRGDDGLTWEATYALSGRSLVVELRSPGGRADGVRCGELVGLPEVRGIEVPYMKFGAALGGPLIAVGDGLFVSVLPDLYESDYSHVDTAGGAPEGDRIKLLGGTVYGTLTDGTRNDLRERFFITVSPEFADTLPNHQNPPSPNRDRLAPYMFVMDRAHSQQRWETMHRYGLDHVIANDFAGIFIKTYSEGFGVRWRPHPDYTIEQVQGWRERIHELGYLFGAYVDVTDWPPLNEWWDENRICLTPEGRLREAWPGSYSPKPDFMRTLTELVGSRVHEHYPPDCVYLDVSTNRGNVALDYEAGAQGAGMARAVVIGNGDSLVEARKWYGSTMSEGIYRWMYAGLCDMDYAQVRMSGDGPPLPLDFDLLKIHPYQHGTMMGYGPTTYLSRDEIAEMNRWGELPGPLPFYKYVGTSIAYGHMMLLGYGYFPPMQTMIQYYALMQGLQQEYLADTAAAIEYHDGERFLPTSAALQQDAHLLGRVRVRYSRGLTVTANLNPEQDWSVEQDGETYELPPFGWVATKPGAIRAFSARVDGVRLDYVQCPQYVYLNSGEQVRRVGPLEVQGAAWLKRTADGWRLIPCGRLGHWTPDQTLANIPADRGTPLLIVDLPQLGLEGATITGADTAGVEGPADGEALGDGRLRLQATADLVEYRLRAGAEGG